MNEAHQKEKKIEIQILVLCKRFNGVNFLIELYHVSWTVQHLEAQ